VAISSPDNPTALNYPGLTVTPHCTGV